MNRYVYTKCNCSVGVWDSGLECPVCGGFKSPSSFIWPEKKIKDQVERGIRQLEKMLAGEFSNGEEGDSYS